MKDEFINNEVWTLTFGGAFQRANVYTVDQNDPRKVPFKTDLRKHIESILPDYISSVDEAEHMENIRSVIICSKKHGAILTNGKLNFGVGQKLLNLYLKYRWCLGDIHEPPHFPLDSRIQELLSITPEAWTKMDSEAEYLKLINKVRAKAKAQNLSLAEFELKYFERRNRTAG